MLTDMNHSFELLISIILPVYNTKDDLPRCIESIINQTYSNIEIIIIDDGSTDGSSEICDKYKMLDPRVYVIHKENGGNMSARKAGLAVAKGDYIGFVDSDDWIEPEMYRKLVRCVEQYNSDIVCSGYYVDDNGSVSEMIDGVRCGLYRKNDNYRSLIKDLIYISGSERNGISMSLCNKIIHKDIAIQVIMGLDDAVQMLEDATCVYSAILRASSTYVLNQSYYHYCRRHGSILHSKDEDYFIKINLAYKALKREFQMYPEYADMLMGQLGKTMIDYLAKGINYFFDFGVKVSIPYYLCPMQKMKCGAKIILYGAGKLGTSYYNQIIKNKNYHLVAWVDKNYASCREKGLNVQPIENVIDMDYDYVLLGVQSSGMANSMKKVLMESGVMESKIIWDEPQCIAEVETEKYGNEKVECERSV